MDVGKGTEAARTLTRDKWVMLNQVAERRVRFWLSIPFTLPSGYYIDGTRASADGHEECEALRLAGLIRVDMENLPFNYVILTAAGAQARRMSHAAGDATDQADSGGDDDVVAYDGTTVRWFAPNEASFAYLSDEHGSEGDDEGPVTTASDA